MRVGTEGPMRWRPSKTFFLSGLTRNPQLARALSKSLHMALSSAGLCAKRMKSSIWRKNGINRWSHVGYKVLPAGAPLFGFLTFRWVDVLPGHCQFGPLQDAAGTASESFRQRVCRCRRNPTLVTEKQSGFALQASQGRTQRSGTEGSKPASAALRLR
eukprot:2032539-Amphidinium_carterae.1